MEKANLLDRITGLIRKMESRATQMQKSDGSVSRLDMDMSLRDTRELYDLLLELEGTVSAGSQQPAQTAPTGETTAPAGAANVGVENITSKTSAPGNGDPEQPGQPGEPGPTKPPEQPEKPEQPEQPEQPERPERPEKTDPPAPSQRSGQEMVSRQRAARMTATLFDQQPGTPGQSVHEKIAQTAGNKSLADTLAASPAGDLKKMIDINEKYKFVNELFDGNLKAYNECIGRLNGAASLSEATGMLEETVVDRYEADKESETFLSLTGLMLKRFTR